MYLKSTVAAVYKMFDRLATDPTLWKVMSFPMIPRAMTFAEAESLLIDRCTLLTEIRTGCPELAVLAVNRYWRTLTTVSFEGSPCRCRRDTSLKVPEALFSAMEKKGGVRHLYLRRVTVNPEVVALYTGAFTPLLTLHLDEVWGIDEEMIYDLMLFADRVVDLNFGSAYISPYLNGYFRKSIDLPF